MPMFINKKLRKAVRTKNLAKVAELLDAGANPSLEDSYGYTVLSDAVYRNNPECVRLLIAHGARADQRTDNSSLLHVAARYDYIDIMKLLLETAPGLIDTVDYNSRTPLHAAAQNGREKAVALLLERKPELIEAKNDDGETALHMAAGAGYLEIVAQLLDKGASPDARNSANRTPLFLAQKANQLQVADLLRPLTPTVKLRSAPGPEEWKKLSDRRIAHVMTEEAIGYRVTEIFNFEARERIRIVNNLETKADQVESRSFDELAEQGPIEAARAELLRQGGDVPESIVAAKIAKLPRPQTG